jgi:simple sugar transport system ATP-binding protein
MGVAHIPEDRHRYGLILDFDLQSNMVLERYYQKPYSHLGWINRQAIHSYSDKIVSQYDVRSGRGSQSIVRDMSGGNQQKAIVGRELDRRTPLLIACQPTRGLDVGAIEYIHNQIVKARDEDKGVLLLSLELEEVMNLSDRVLVMYEGEIVADLNPKEITLQELGLYMSGAKRMELPVLPDIMASVSDSQTVLDDAYPSRKRSGVGRKSQS